MNSKKNSPYYGRFKDLSWFDGITEKTVIIGGAGGIGSHLAFQLARTGTNIIIYDFDTVEETNLAGQLFGKADVGKTKVQAVSDVIDRLCGENRVNAFAKKIEAEKGGWRNHLMMADVVCAVFDNIAARKLMYDYWKANCHGADNKDSLFVDARMAAENGQVFVVHSKSSEENLKIYETNFFDDSEVEEQPCSAKATTHCGSMIAAFIVSQISNWVNNLDEKAASRSLPDMIEFHIPVALFRARYNPSVTEVDLVAAEPTPEVVVA